jgi:tetratricopeptide (TPR) repeat protein
MGNLVAGVEGSMVGNELELAACCALAAAPAFESKGPYLDGVTLLNRVPAERVEPGLRNRLLRKSGLLLWRAGQMAKALTHCEQAIVIAREVGGRRGEGRALNNLGNVHLDQGRITEALTHYERAIAIAREVGDRRTEGINCGSLGVILHQNDDMLGADQHLQQAIEICDEALPPAAGDFRGTLALIRAESGALDEARTLFEKGDSQLRGVDAFELAKLLCVRAQVEQLAGDTGAASAALAEAETIAEEIRAGADSDLSQELTKARTALAKRHPLDPG